MTENETSLQKPAQSRRLLYFLRVMAVTFSIILLFALLFLFWGWIGDGRPTTSHFKLLLFAVFGTGFFVWWHEIINNAMQTILNESGIVFRKPGGRIELLAWNDVVRIKRKTSLIFPDYWLYIIETQEKTMRLNNVSVPRNEFEETLRKYFDGELIT